MSYRLTERAFKLTMQELHGYHSTPSSSQQDAIRSYLSLLESMVDGKAKPLAHLIPLDPGYGKTLAATCFFETLLNTPELSHEGVLYVAERREELNMVFKQMGRPDSVGILTTTDNDYAYPANATLVGEEGTDAQILLTTKKMIEKRIVVNSDGSDAILKYRGKARRVRIWDEAFLPARPITISRPDLQLLAGYLKAHDPKLYESIDTLIDDMKNAKDGQLLQVPDITFGRSLNDLLGWLETSTRLQHIAIDLWQMSGNLLRITKDGYKGETFTGHIETLTPNLLPMAVLDASGRFSEVYPIQDLYRQNMCLARLGNYKPKRYDDLLVRLAQRPSSKSAWQNKDEAKFLAAECIKAIESDPERTWLIIHHKSVDMQGLILELNPEICDLDVEYLTLGQHTATNKHSDRDGVIIAGTLFYPLPSYYALRCAASGLPIHKLPTDNVDISRLRRSESMHHFFQAVARGTVRQTRHGRCGPMVAYVIASARSGITKESIKEVFPGCRVEPWILQKPATKLAGRAKEAYEAVYRWAKQARIGDSLQFAKVITGHRGLFKRLVRDNPNFNLALEAIGVREHKSGKRRTKWVKFKTA